MSEAQDVGGTASRRKTPIVWTIAGSDCGGGAGIQADLHTFHDFGVHGCSVITAATAQNSCSFISLNALDADVVRAQIDACLLYTSRAR